MSAINTERNFVASVTRDRHQYVEKWRKNVEFKIYTESTYDILSKKQFDTLKIKPKLKMTLRTILNKINHEITVFEIVRLHTRVRNEKYILKYFITTNDSAPILAL